MNIIATRRSRCEAFKGDQVDWRSENSAKNWATAYDFPAVRDKKVVLEEFPIRNLGVMQAFAFNIRRDKFKDARVRRAFNFAFDFEEMNRQIFFGQYKRIASYFEGTELASSGVPEGLELEILKVVKDQVPAELFTQPYSNPAGGNPQAVRDNFRHALALFRDAGYDIKDTKLVNAKTGEQFRVEFLVDDPVDRAFRAVLQALARSHRHDRDDARGRCGAIRKPPAAVGLSTSSSRRGPSRCRPATSSATSGVLPPPTSPVRATMIGIKNPAVDTLIERVIFSKDRAELVAATKALDRVLLWNYYVVPQWTYGKQRTARWDRFGHPDNMPKYGAAAFPTVWWWDADKAAKVPQRS